MQYTEIDDNYRFIDYVVVNGLTTTLAKIIDDENINWSEVQNIKKEDLRLIHAILVEDKNFVEENIKQIGFSSHTNTLLQGLLRSTAKYNQIEVVRILLTCEGINVNAKDKDGVTALHCAAYRRCDEIVRILLNNGADVNAKDHRGKTALYEAIISENIKIIEALLKQGADMSTILYSVAMNRYIEVIYVLLSYNNSYVSNILFQAIKYEQVDLVKALLTRNDVDLKAKDEEGKTVLHYAVEYRGNIEIVEALLAEDIDLNAKDNDGRTALHYAVECRGNIKIVETLLAKGIDLKTKDKEIVEALLAKGIDLNAKDNDGRTALHYAVANKDIEIVEALLAKDIDLKAKDKDGRTVLHYAIANEDIEIVEALLAKDIDLKAKDKDGRTALHCAVYKGCDKVVSILLDKGADVNAKDENGVTALHYAVIFGCIEIVEALLARNDVDLKAKDQQGWTPLAIAKAYTQNNEITKILLEHMEQISVTDTGSIADGQIKNKEFIHSSDKWVVPNVICAEIYGDQVENTTLLGGDHEQT